MLPAFALLLLFIPFHSQLFRTAHANFRPDRAAAFTRAPEGAEELHHRLGVNIHFLDDNRALDLARDAGFSFVRVDLLWAQLERHGQYNFAPFDGLMHSLDARRMGVLWLLAYGHPDHGGQSPQSDADIAAYARYAAAVVAHFRGRNAVFEIWNEPNGKQFLADPATYPRLLRAALDSIRREDPEAAVSTGGTSGFDFPFLTRMLKSGSTERASAVAVHPYRDSAPETLRSDLSVLRDLIQRTVGPKPIWDTEWGYSSYGKASKDLPGGGHSDVGRQRQAVLVARECLTQWVLGLPITVVYDLRDDGSNPFDREDNFGLIEQSNSDKPAMKVIRVLSTVAQNHNYSGLIRDAPYGLHAMRLDGANDIVFVVWNDATETRPKIGLSRDELLSLTNLFGEPMSTQGEEITLQESEGPIYLRLRRR